MDLRAIANERRMIGAYSSKQRILSEDYEEIGLAGEVAFSEEFGLPLIPKRGSDNGIDFITRAGSIDVKTARNPSFLFMEEGKFYESDILVLAGYDDFRQNAWLIGWEFSWVMASEPVRGFGKGVRNHYKIAGQLRKIEELQRRIEAAGPGEEENDESQCDGQDEVK